MALRFKSYIKEALSRIASNPNFYPAIPEMEDIQKYTLSQFPYAIFYLNLSDCIWIIAFAHSSRRPGYWTERMSS